MIDRENPSASPLVIVPIRPHGESEIPIFTVGDARQYQKLVAWVRQIVRADTQPKQPQSVVRPSEALLQNIPSADDPRKHSQSEQSTDDHPRPNETAPSQGANANGPPPAGYTAVDPFDPEIFNRRFFPPDSDE